MLWGTSPLALAFGFDREERDGRERFKGCLLGLVLPVRVGGRLEWRWEFVFVGIEVLAVRRRRFAVDSEDSASDDRSPPCCMWGLLLLVMSLSDCLLVVFVVAFVVAFVVVVFVVVVSLIIFSFCFSSCFSCSKNSDSEIG